MILVMLSTHITSTHDNNNIIYWRDACIYTVMYMYIHGMKAVVYHLEKRVDYIIIKTSGFCKLFNQSVLLCLFFILYESIVSLNSFRNSITVMQCLIHLNKFCKYLLELIESFCYNSKIFNLDQTFGLMWDT